ncbi:MAG: cytochrome c [Gemmatimonadetes bacterium]|uniref:Cytochrome c n=1 Tax=Candidatus Kutchimonas denitrificans TaxID=3056748 RepID=A0AAE4Z7Q3_9BACT|nr:cytochrome c [Gemmatimonadota bacterium]NIR74764.1 cytochrome c [Candidatus Kutchimonas denitrificans]NIS01514.1 cytochrome c [Gemmatimonadota bacterium]NIT67255.1 cytochrome c [Gemmatimonadota bacterium]NIU52429.1 c-type cytochrome [Gemmatimonadota bacterium]
MRHTTALVGVLLIGCPLPALGQESVTTTQNPLRGAQIFGSRGCVNCHAVDGLGGDVGPDLARSSRHRTIQEFAATMWNHLPIMSQRMQELGIELEELNASEAADLVAFLFTIGYFDPPGDVARGKELFREKKCIVCHQIGSRGGVIGPNLDFVGQYGSPILVAAAMWNHGPAMAEAMEARGLERPTFSSSELAALISYLESVSSESLDGDVYVLPGRPSDGRVIFVEKRCIECHGVAGRGGGIGGDLAQRELHRGLMEFAVAMWNKAPAMMGAMERRGVSVPQVGAVEMADIVAYLYSVRYFAESGNSARGRRHLEEKRCLGCHSLEGRGGDIAVDFSQLTHIESSAALIAAVWNHSMVMEAAMEERELPWPTFSADEMADLAAFFQTVAGTR